MVMGLSGYICLLLALRMSGIADEWRPAWW